jgi:signal peptidase II
MNQRYRILAYSLIAVAAAALDLISKYLVVTNLHQGNPVNIIGDFLRFTFIWNPGITFGFLSGAGGTKQWVPFLLIAFATAALVLVIFLFFRIPRYLKPGWPVTTAKVAAMMVSGGAAGNITDRLIRGAVVDFIDVGIGHLRWYIFNVADCFVVVGAIVLFLLFFFFEKKPEKASEPVVHPFPKD